MARRLFEGVRELEQERLAVSAAGKRNAEGQTA